MGYLVRGKFPNFIAGQTTLPDQLAKGTSNTMGQQPIALFRSRCSLKPQLARYLGTGRRSFRAEHGNKDFPWRGAGQNTARAWELKPVPGSC